MNTLWSDDEHQPHDEPTFHLTLLTFLGMVFVSIILWCVIIAVVVALWWMLP